MDDEKTNLGIGPYTGQTIIWEDKATGRSFSVHTTLPLDRDDPYRNVNELVTAECILGESIIGSYIWLSHYAIVETTEVDRKTGQHAIIPRVIFVQAEGPPVAFEGETVLKALAKLAFDVGKAPPWQPAIKVKVQGRSRKSGGKTVRFLRIEV